MNEAVAAVILWLSQHTAYDIPSQPPQVVVEQHSVIQSIQQAQGDFWGAYDYRFNRVWLSDRVDLDSVHGRSFLAHELVHWLQDEARYRTYACYGETEFEASAIQERYQEDHGGDSTVNWVDVAARYTCPPAFVPVKWPDGWE